VEKGTDRAFRIGIDGERNVAERNAVSGMYGTEFQNSALLLSAGGCTEGMDRGVEAV
jgi:hypothetical protein